MCTLLGRTLLLFALILTFVANTGYARVTPSSGRYLKYDHWLTCTTNSSSAYRGNPGHTNVTPTKEIYDYLDQLTFSGAYAITVKDTWEEWVTKYGTSCSHCGESCTEYRNSDGSTTKSCTCDSCSWQELETFYSPWSNQKVTWNAKFRINQGYLNKRDKWFKANGNKPIPPVTDTSRLNELLTYDPAQRPYAEFLFPGELEEIVAYDNAFGNRVLKPALKVNDARNDYSIQTASTAIESRNSSGIASEFPCDDVDLHMDAKIIANKRIQTVTPNSLVFKNWFVASTDSSGNLTSEPDFFNIIDQGALAYENQNIIDNYKESSVRVYLRQLDRAWGFDRRVGSKEVVSDQASILHPYDEYPNDNRPGYAEFQIPGEMLRHTPLFGSEFHLKPEATYEMCAQLQRRNNIYYESEGFLGRDLWSEPKCATFTYRGQDLRSGGRKFRDGFTKIFPLPFWW